MNALQYLDTLIGDDADELFGDHLPEEFRPLSSSEVAALESKGKTMLPSEVREFLLTLGTAGIMDAGRFERFDPVTHPDYELLRLWNKAAGNDSLFESYMSDDAEGSIEEATNRYRADMDAAHEISERAVMLDAGQFGNFTILDPETSKVYDFCLEHDDSPNCLAPCGSFRGWAAEQLQSNWG